MAYGNAIAGTGDNFFEGKIVAYPVDSATKIFEGSAVFVKDGVAGFDITAGNAYVGLANETVDNPTSGDLTIIVRTTGVYKLTGAGLASTDVGKTVYLDATKNPQTFTTTKPSGVGSLIVALGKITQVLSATQAYVRIDGFAGVNNIVAGS